VAVKPAARFAAAVVALALVAGCGNDKSGPNPMVAAIGSMAKSGVAKVKGKPTGPQPAAAAKAATPADLRAQLEKAGQPVLLVAAETLGRTSFLGVVDGKAGVQTWESPEGASFSLRDGILIQTRGLGADLMSSDAPSLAQLRAGGSYQRLYFFLGPDDQGTRRTYDCTTKVVGAEAVDVLAKSFQTTHVTETCQRPLGSLTNDFWIDGGMIRQSRQWVSASVGYVQFQRVVD
jgi:Group 4 capsule polysaccharide lipoprotein gfcB, YjbF